MKIFGKSSCLFIRAKVPFRCKYSQARMPLRCLSTENQSAEQTQANSSTSSTTSSTSSTGSFFSSGVSTTARRRPYNVESKLRLQEYRRQAAQQQREMELDEERRTFQLDKSKLYPKGHPSTVQGVVKEIIDIGYILTLPDKTEGLLAAMHLGCSGGVELLSRLYAVGEEIPVRVIKVPWVGGKHRCYVRDINSLPDIKPNN